MTHASSKSAGLLAAHLSRIVEQRLQKLVTSVKVLSVERSVETVHDLRVASRRLRAFGVTFQDRLGNKTRARLEKQLKRLTKIVGPLRDLDVLVALVEQRAAAAAAASDLERAALEHLLETLDARRSLAAAGAVTRLRKLELQALSDRLRRAARDVAAGLGPDEAQRAYARMLLEGLIVAAAEQEPPRDGVEHVEQLHGLRIAIKELRYALEFLEPVLGEHFATLYARAEALQELLGTHHDLTVLGEIVLEQSQHLAARSRPALAAGLQQASAALLAERRAVLARFECRGFERGWWREQLNLALA
jgi:CHAD domain-containing protein